MGELREPLSVWASYASPIDIYGIETAKNFIFRQGWHHLL